MARKHPKNEQELPFVALMDTMTNVVGVLTIVLVMMGISLARAASRVFSALPPATEAQVHRAQIALDRLHADQTPLQEKLKKLTELEITPEKLAALDAEVANLKRKIEEKGIKPLNLDAMSQDRAKREAELQQKNAAVKQLMAERDRIKALLDDTPVPKAPPAKVVRIPASRPIPEGAKIEHVLVTNNGPHWINVKAIKAAFLNGFKSPSMRPMVHSEVRRGKKTVVIYDYTKLLHYFEKQKVTFHEFHVDVVWVDWSSSPLLRLVPETASSAALQDALERFNRIPKTVVMFQVTADGFEKYLAARKECDAMGVPAGWEFAGAAEYSVHIPELETNKPPVTAKPAAGPPPANEIKPPSQKLD
jgi:hypothetical protein